MIQVSRNQKAASAFAPMFQAASIHAVDFKQLQQLGVRYVALDADSTMVAYRGKKLDPEVLKHLKQQQKYIDGWCIASNRLIKTLNGMSAELQAPIVPTSIWVRKPQRRYFRRLVKHFRAERPSQVAMIGDKLFSDVWGANRAGLVSVWVGRIGNDGLHDRILGVRQREHWWLKRRGVTNHVQK